MTLIEKKAYLLKFVCQGITLDKALPLVYCTEDETEAINADISFQNDVKEIQLSLSLRWVEQYNTSVDYSVMANDKLKRITTLLPTIISKEQASDNNDLNLVINKIRGNEN